MWVEIVKLLETPPPPTFVSLYTNVPKSQNFTSLWLRNQRQNLHKCIASINNVMNSFGCCFISTDYLYNYIRTAYCMNFAIYLMY